MRAKPAAQWERIRDDFIATGQSYRELAEKYGVGLSTLKRRAAAEKWVAARAVVADAVILEPAETGTSTDTVGDLSIITDLKRERYQKFMEITDAMMDRIQDALTSPAVISPYSLKLLASALRDLREMQGLNKTALDIEEQQARIAKLRSEIHTVESPEDQAIVVEFVDTYGAEA